MAFLSLFTTACSKYQTTKTDVKNTEVYYSQWYTPTIWSGRTGEWFFNVSAPKLTQDNIENGVILAYVWLTADSNSSTAIRPLPAYTVGSTWSFLIRQYGKIEITNDMISHPLTTDKIRFVVIPATSSLKATAAKYKTKTSLTSLPYNQACKLFNIKDSLLKQ